MINPTPNVFSTCELGLGVSLINANEPSVADDTIAPSGVVFSAAAKNARLSLGTLAPNATKAVWIKRTIAQNAPAYDFDFVSLGVDTINYVDAA